MQIDWKRAIIAGLVGTVVFDVTQAATATFATVPLVVAEARAAGAALMSRPAKQTRLAG